MRAAALAIAIAACLAPLSGAAAATLVGVGPTYTHAGTDCTTNGNKTATGDGKFAWTVGSGCDKYKEEFYERPITQTLENSTVDGMIAGAVEYQENLDIRRARAGVTDEFFFVGIEMVGLDKVTQNGVETPEGLIYRYQFLVGAQADGGGGWMFEVDAPALANNGKELESVAPGPNNVFDTHKTRGYWDENGDVGGSGAANGLFTVAQGGDGFERNDLLQDGRYQVGAKPDVLYARVNPKNDFEVEFALRYTQIPGLSRTMLESLLGGTGYLDFRSIKGGAADPQNYLWNDKYTYDQAGNPYKVGTQNVYLLDTLRGVSPVVPEPSTWMTMIIGFGMVGGAIRRAPRGATRSPA